jgi:ABC-type Fe3+ transport system substrate-binding protein
MELSPSEVLEKGYLLGWYNLEHPIAYNASMINAGDIPKTWSDLLDPKWKGKIIVEARAKPFGYLGLAWGKEKMLDYLKQLKTQELIYAKGGTTVATLLVAGQAPIGVGTYAYKIDMFRLQKKAPVDWVASDVLGASQFSLATLKGAQHPAAAQLWAAWLGSPDGLKAMYEVNGRGSARPGSGSRIADKIEKAGSKLFIEDSTNSEQEDAMEKEAAKALGVVK